MHVSHPSALLQAPLSPGVLSYLQLRRCAAAFMRNYPDLHSLAYQAAKRIIELHTGQKSLSPADVYWHRFSGAMNSSRTFTGWQHSGRPTESLTLIELVMHRFSADDQEAPDDLNVYGGFYTAGPDAQLYDEHNEVPMLPGVVLRDFWAIDFASACRQKVEAFWREHAQEFCAFAKARLLSAAGLALSSKQLALEDFQSVLRVLTGDTNPQVTWAMLQDDVPVNEEVLLGVFELAGHASRNTLCLSTRSGRHIVYQPDAQPAFLTFADSDGLRRWVTLQMSEPSSADALVSRFVRGRKQQAAFAKALSRLGDQAFKDRHVARAAPGQAFEQLRNRAHQEMREDVHEQLTSSASLRKQMWIGYLGAFIQITGAFAPIGWPVALTLVGAGLASIGLNTDQAIGGRTKALRKSGLVGAIVNSVYLLFNLPLLADFARPKSLVQPVQSEVVSGEAALSDLEGDITLPETPPSVAKAHYRAVHLLDNGESWIRLDGRPFRVQFVQDLKLWFIVKPDNPFSFSGARLVRLNEADQWELVAGLKLGGGSPMEATAGPSVSASPSKPPFESVTSAFWDTHMRFNLAEEQRLSELGNDRQEALINVYEAGLDEEVVSGSDGDETVVDAFGERHRVFRSAHEWFGGAITRYTQDEDSYNVFLRTGTRLGYDQVQTIQRLVDDLAQVDYNNDVPLYRGGSGNRGTSGVVFREGKFKSGDVLVNTDITSFSENPYVSRVFASSQGGAASQTFHGQILFDDTSVVFELPAGEYLSATPISPFSVSPEEVESVFLPGSYFEIQHVQEVTGPHYRFMNVRLKQIPVEQISGPVYDLRTGMPFSRDEHAKKLGAGAEVLMDSFFPLSTL